MKRRIFIKTSVAAAGLAGSLEISPLLVAQENESPGQVSSDSDNRSEEFLTRVQEDPFLPPPPETGRPYPLTPMPAEQRISRKLVPQQGFCSIAPAETVSEALISGNGSMNIELVGDPYSEEILFHHESLLMPWKRPLEAPKVADTLQQIRQLALEGKNSQAISLAVNQMNESPVKQDTEPHLTIPAFLMRIGLPKTNSVSNYLRTLDFGNGEIRVFWSDENGDWLRQTFVSRPDNVVVQHITAPEGKTANIDISLEKSAGWSFCSGMDWGARRGIGTTDPDMRAFVQLAAVQQKLAPKGVETCEVRQETTDQWLIYKCRLDPFVNNSGYVGMTRVVISGGSSRTNGNTMHIENASSVILLTRIEHFEDFNEKDVTAFRNKVEEITADYDALLRRHQEVQTEMLNRVKVDFGGKGQFGLSIEELLTDQRSRPDYSPALLEKIFEMGRYWFILNSGKYPAIAPGINSTINLLTAGAVQGNLREGMEAYFRWMEEIAPDCRNNARNIFGMRGTSYPLFPDKGMGVNFYYTSASEIGIWPYWISAGGWLVRQFWEYYLVSGDFEFLRNRVIPVYKELAEFYEDFLTVEDKNGNFTFVPSISPENTSRIAGQTGTLLLNANIDIAVCREVLAYLVQACEILGIEAENVMKWNGILSKLPPYLLEQDGTLKEWAWPSAEEHYSHRHISHLYGAWPGDEIDPDRTPLLARAAVLANRRRIFDAMSTAVAGETLAAYTRCHRALAGARLKDSIIVDMQLRQLMEQGYISSSLRTSREPYGVPVPDAQGGIPAIIMEMVAYSRPGVIEILPALPPSLVKGTVTGMLVRSFARLDKLSWDLQTGTVEMVITSMKTQDLTLVARHGIENIEALPGVLVEKLVQGRADVEIHLPEKKPVEIKIELGNHNPADWVNLTV